MKNLCDKIKSLFIKVFNNKKVLAVVTSIVFVIAGILVGVILNINHVDIKATTDNTQLNESEAVAESNIATEQAEIETEPEIVEEESEIPEEIATDVSSESTNKSKSVSTNNNVPADYYNPNIDSEGHQRFLPDGNCAHEYGHYEFGWEIVQEAEYETYEVIDEPEHTVWYPDGWYEARNLAYTYSWTYDDARMYCAEYDVDPSLIRSELISAVSHIEGTEIKPCIWQQFGRTFCKYCGEIYKETWGETSTKDPYEWFYREWYENMDNNASL